jgi:hypothetical protein
MGTSGADLILIQSIDERAFAEGLGAFDVIDFRSSAAQASDYTIRG